MVYDLRKLLGMSWFYRGFQTVAGGSSRATYVQHYLRPTPGMRVLDVGCGPGDILNYLDESVDYTGIDLSAAYIAAARRHFGGRGRFINESVADVVVRESNSFDLVMANGLIHHLDDAEVRRLLCIAREALKPGGRFVSLDGCFAEGESRLARFIVSHDRGRHVRPWRDYVTLAREAFPTVEYHVRHDLMRMPYTHLVMICTRQPTVDGVARFSPLGNDREQGQGSATAVRVGSP